VGLGEGALPPGHKAAEAPPLSAEAALGARTVRLEPSSDRVRVYLLEAGGASAEASGQGAAVLKTEGEADQSVELVASEDHWYGEAKLKPAVGYEAEVTLPVDGADERVTLRWGFVVDQGAPTDPGDLPEGKAEPPGRAERDGVAPSGG